MSTEHLNTAMSGLIRGRPKMKGRDPSVQCVEDIRHNSGWRRILSRSERHVNTVKLMKRWSYLNQRPYRQMAATQVTAVKVKSKKPARRQPLPSELEPRKLKEAFPPIRNFLFFNDVFKTRSISNGFGDIFDHAR